MCFEKPSISDFSEGGSGWTGTGPSRELSLGKSLTCSRHIYLKLFILRNFGSVDILDA